MQCGPHFVNIIITINEYVYMSKEEYENLHTVSLLKLVASGGYQWGGRQKWVEIEKLFFIYQVKKQNKDREKYIHRANMGHNIMNISSVLNM